MALPAVGIVGDHVAVHPLAVDLVGNRAFKPSQAVDILSLNRCLGLIELGGFFYVVRYAGSVFDSEFVGSPFPLQASKDIARPVVNASSLMERFVKAILFPLRMMRVYRAAFRHDTQDMSITWLSSYTIPVQRSVSDIKITGCASG